MLPTPQTSPPNGIAELSSDSVIDGRYQGKNTNDLSHEFGQMFPLPVFMREDKPTAPLGTSLAKLFQTAVELASKSEAQYRITLRRLASEGGLERLEESMDTITKASSLQAKIVLWDSQLKPCFQILTNQQAQSKALERSVQSIYSLLAGPKFDRLRSILQLVCNIAEAWVSSEDHLEITRQQELYELSSAVLRNALLAVPTNPPDAGFRELVLRFSKMFENAGTRLLSISRDRVKTDLERVLDVLSENIVPSVPGLQQNLTSYDSFTSGSDGPGHLSSQGIRHDNDHATITSIRILPTTSEIMSTRIPYIPPYDPSKWHIRGLQGLLDRHFRLLREDNLGPVRDVVRMLVGGSHASTAIYQGNTLRTNEYKLQSMRVAYDRINGFELHISTRQPSEVVKRLTSAHREQWWMETNNLDWERLICLIAQDHVMFCVVSRATCRKSTQLTETRDNSKKKRIRKYDPKRTLFGARDFAYFVLQPVDVQTKDIDFILNARLGVVGNITVVEFPTLLLASFQPTLSALQSMYASPQVPLGEYLVGNVGKHGNNNQVDEHIPPPVYAMNNFEFNLQPLLKTRSNISYAPRNEPETRELCDRTSLDEGQARALLNSLRRRLALIQVCILSPQLSSKLLTHVYPGSARNRQKLHW